MNKLGRYELTSELTNKNGGYCMWCFGTADGEEYFIKEFLSPKYPLNDTASKPEKIARKLADCQAFEQEKRRLYQLINTHSDGNLARITELFRVDTKYYMSMRKIKAEPLKVADVAKLDERTKYRICSVISHAIAQLHKGGIVHADIKHDNILFCRSASGALTAKVIDYDNGFFEDHPPRCGEEIVGDQAYFSPEAILSSIEIEAPLTCKMDIFALGVLFHQYFSGEYPIFDEEKYCSAGVAAIEGAQIKISPKVPEEIAPLIAGMLRSNPEDRPTALEVYREFGRPSFTASAAADTSAFAKAGNLNRES